MGWECESRVPTGSSLSWEPCLFADNHKAFLLRVVGPTKGRLRLPVRGYEGRTMYTEGVYIRVIGLAPEHDTTPPKADLTKIQPW